MVEKELGLKSKKDIEEMGVAKFNKACRDSVLRFADEWKKFVERVGRFVDYDNSYKTMDNSYIESVWWGLKQIYDKGRLYEGRKVLMYCPRCETPLAKAEVAMDNSYKDVTEESVYVKFKIKSGQKIGDYEVGDSTYLLAWTTTPWTLPGNVALAVGKDIQYTLVASKNGEVMIMGSERITPLGIQGAPGQKVFGKELVGLEYEPLYELPAVKDTGKRAWYVASGDFVTTEDGTGIVHTAVIYGEEDYKLGLELDLPMVPLLDQATLFNESAPEFIRGQYFKKAEKAIKSDLEERNLLFRREMNTHSYPHCHRCGTPLIYNALTSWFINIQDVKSRMVELNEKINWIPEHLKHGRFLNNVENAPDWTVSRNRYWASPLPIWKSTSGERLVVGSVEELKKYTKSRGNKFIFMRHGESEGNSTDTVSFKKGLKDDHLTDKGKEQVLKSAQELKNKKIDVVISSPFARTRETAEIVAKELGIGEVVYDERLGELDPGSFDGKNWFDYHSAQSQLKNWYRESVSGGESYADLVKRVGGVLYELEQNYQGKNILIVSHGSPIWAGFVVSGSFMPEGNPYKVPEQKEETEIFVPKFKRMQNAEIRELDFVPLPHNENFELDLHKPYIDEVVLMKDGTEYRRIPEVLDGWVESGSMPFAEHHYPFENKDEFKTRFPADFIAEYIAQTRTWFYYMHAMAVQLFDNISFKNVVTTGTILATDGSKMSKSKGNYTDPLENINIFSADALRYYLMSSVVMQAEDIRFSDDEVKQANGQLINILWNTYNFYSMYTSDTEVEASSDSNNVLDEWIMSRLSELTVSMTEGMEVYDIVKATRPIKDFVSDFSTWYLRRSRDRFKSDNEKDKKDAIATTRYVLLTLSKLIAPVMPFIAEDIYQNVRKNSDPESVHLEQWPEPTSPSAKGESEGVLTNMPEVRRLASLALEQRQKANIKVRQPLSKLKVKSLKLKSEYLELIKEELNVKEVVVDENLEGEVELDTKITPELAEEGKVRDVIRAIQNWRKEQGLNPGDDADYPIPSDEKELFARNKLEIENLTNVKLIEN